MQSRSPNMLTYAEALIARGRPNVVTSDGNGGDGVSLE